MDLQPVTVVTIGAAVVYGMVLALLGSLKLDLAKRLDIGEGRIGTLFAIFNLTLMPMMVLSGVLIDLGGATGMLVFGSFITAVALFSLGLRPTYSGAVAALLLTGLGSAGLSTASIVLMPQTLFGPAKIAASFNLGTVFFALGALITPPLAAVLLRKFAWRQTLGVMAVLCLVPAILAAFFHQQLAELHSAPTPLPELFAGHAVWLAGLVFFFYAPLEAAISIWATKYLADTGHGESKASWLLSGFWAAFLASRLLVAFAQQGGIISDRWDRPLIVVPPILVAVVLGNLVGAANRNLAWRGTMLLGFLLGPIFPNLLSVLFGNLKLEGINANGTAYGVIFAAGSVGSLVLAPLIGSASRRNNVQMTLRIPMFIALLLAMAGLVFCLLV